MSDRSAGSEPMDLSEKKSCSVESEWVYISNRRKAKKEISADHKLPVDRVHGSGSFDRPACNGPDPGPAK